MIYQGLTGTVDGRARPVIARSHGLLFFLLLPLTRDNQFDGNLPAGENTVGGRSSLSDGN